MTDLMANYREYVRLTQNRLEASGFNPHMAGVYAVMAEIAEQASDEAGYQRLYAERGLELETYRASALDTYSARLRQARDDDLPEKNFYTDLVERIRAAADQEAIAREINSGMERITEEQKKRQQREYWMRTILDNLMQYAFTSPLLDLKRSIDGAQEAMKRVRAAEGDPDAMLRDPKWRTDYALPDKFWALLEEAYESVKAGRKPAKDKAEAELQEEYTRSIKELSDLKGKMSEHYAAHDALKESKRSTWVAYATPEGYEYECVWMKGGR